MKPKDNGQPPPGSATAPDEHVLPSSVGFPRYTPTPGPNPPARPTPLPKRPKGRWFVALLLLTACGTAAYQVWHSFFRFQAYGTITGRVIQLSPPWDGVVRYLHVKEGQHVRQRDLLVTVENSELRHRHAQLGDELRIAQATLEAESAKLKWQLAFNLDQGHGAWSQYYEALGQLLQEQAKYEELQSAFERVKRLQKGYTISDEEFTRLHWQLQGQGQKVAQLREAVDGLKRRAQQTEALVRKGPEASGLVETGADQLKPHATGIEALQAERARLQERLDQGQVRASTNGLVIKTQRFAGESCKPGEPLLSLLEEGSLQVVLYLPQNASTTLAVDRKVDLVVEPYPECLQCTVTRWRDEYEHAPEHLKRYYSEGQKLFPVILQPGEEWSRWMALRVGGVVKLPYPIPFLGGFNHD
jgi:multidrug resistance efflux pump